ncbi:MAG: AraC family transcriptional regulator [Bacteroidota bacterium]
MSNSFEFIDIILFVGFVQGLFLTFTLQRISNTNKRANAMLLLVIGIVTVMLIGRFVFFRFFSPWIFQWSLLVDTILYLFGPLLYVYVRRLLFKEEESYFLPGYHFLPTVLFLIATGYYLIAYTPDAYLAHYRAGGLDLFFALVTASVKLLNAAYILASFMLVRRYKQSEKRVLSYHQNPVKYLNYFLVAVGLCLLAWVLSSLNYNLLDRYFTYVDYNTVWVAIAIFMYVIGYYSLKQPELFRMAMNPAVKQKKDRLSPSEATVLSQKLDQLMKVDKFYLKSDLTLKQTAEVLQTSSNNISWLLNNVYQTTFYDYINGFRIQEFVQKVENREHLTHTILALSYDVGFNSKSTFNKAFKLTMNNTPSEFIKKHRAA